MSKKWYINIGGKPYLIKNIFFKQPGGAINRVRHGFNLKDGKMQINYSAAEYILTLPTQANSLTYNEKEQTPSWTNYDPAQLILSGQTKGTNAGDYNVTFTPYEGFGWTDWTEDAKATKWTIGRADQALSANPNPLALNTNNSGTTTLSYKGSPTISLTNNSSSFMNVSRSASSVTVTRTTSSAFNGSVTINAAATQNYSGKSITLNVTAANCEDSCAAGCTGCTSCSGCTQQCADSCGTHCNNACTTTCTGDQEATSGHDFIYSDALVEGTYSFNSMKSEFLDRWHKHFRHCVLCDLVDGAEWQDEECVARSFGTSTTAYYAIDTESHYNATCRPCIKCGHATVASYSTAKHDYNPDSAYNGGNGLHPGFEVDDNETHTYHEICSQCGYEHSVTSPHTDAALMHGGVDCEICGWDGFGFGIEGPDPIELPIIIPRESQAHFTTGIHFATNEEVGTPRTIDLEQIGGRNLSHNIAVTGNNETPDGTPILVSYTAASDGNSATVTVTRNIVQAFGKNGQSVELTITAEKNDKYLSDSVSARVSADCYDSCDAKCASSCVGGCGNNCSGGCVGSCQTECTNTCYHDCEEDCYGQCVSGCRDTCKDTCKNNCGNNCGTSCSDSCEDACSVCTNSCGSSCNKACATSCGNSCSGSCENDKTATSGHSWDPDTGNCLICGADCVHEWDFKYIPYDRNEHSKVEYCKVCGREGNTMLEAHTHAYPDGAVGGDWTCPYCKYSRLDG